MKESYLKGIKPLTSYDDLQRELVLLERSDLPFTREEFSIRWKALNEEIYIHGVLRGFGQRHTSPI